MRPADNPREWRKARRAAFKGHAGGRRSTHQTRIEPPRRSSTWLRRHRWQPDFLTYWMENAR